MRVIFFLTITIIFSCGQSQPIVVVLPYNTFSAYDLSRGSNMYRGKDCGRECRERKVPYVGGLDKFSKGFFDWLDKQPEKNQFRFIEDRDMDNFANIANAKVLVIIGHSEYWTRQARINFDNFVDQGGNVAFLSADFGYQVRYENDLMVGYKKLSEDPEPNPLLKTVLWSNPILEYPISPSLGNSFEWGGMGSHDLTIVTNSPIFNGIDITKPIKLDTHEFDGVPLLGFKSSGEPIPDVARLGFYKFQLLAYSKGTDYTSDPESDFYVNNDLKAHTFIAFQKTKNSGVILNVGSVNWCSDLSGDIGIITHNIIFKLLNNEEVIE